MQIINVKVAKVAVFLFCCCPNFANKKMSTSTLKTSYSGIKSLFELIFPNLCACCQTANPIQGGLFCLVCENDFSYCRFRDGLDNPMAERWLGKTPVHWMTSLLFFSAENRVQDLLHRLKYQNQKKIGLEMGRRLGILIRETCPPNYLPEIIVPVPLHPKKEFTRGYNQSALIAQGVAGIIGAKVKSDLLRRQKNTPTQTRKNKMERLENVKNAFILTDPSVIKNRRVLLIDDVFTSGATMEACAHAMRSFGVTESIALACLAIADEW
jgi:ComF family protein